MASLLTQDQALDLLDGAHAGAVSVNSIHKHGRGYVVLYKTQVGGQNPVRRVAVVCFTSEGCPFRKTDFIVD